MESSYFSNKNESMTESDDENDSDREFLIRSPRRQISARETTKLGTHTGNRGETLRKKKQRKNKIEGFMPPLSLARDVRVGYSVDAPMSMVPNAAFRAPSLSYRGSLKHFNDSENRFMMNSDGSIENQKFQDPLSSNSQIGAINKTEDALEIQLPPVIYDRLMYAPQRSRLYGGGDAIRGDLAIAPASHGGWFDVSVNPETDLRSGAMGILIGHNNEAGRALADLKSKYTLGFRNHYNGPSWDERDKPMSRDTLPLYQDLLKLK